MRIGFDAKRLYNNFTGLGNYSRTLLSNLMKYHPGEEYFLYTTKLSSDDAVQKFTQSNSVTTRFPGIGSGTFWRSYSVINQIKKDRIDLFHGLSGEIPFSISRGNLRSIVTVHDLIFLVYPGTYKPADRFLYDLKFRFACKKAGGIIAISNSTRDDIIKYYDADPSKIRVIYQSCDPVFFSPADMQIVKTVTEKYNLPANFLLYVGSVIPRKNLKNVINALSIVPHDLRLPLVVVGDGGSYKREMQRLISEKKLEDIVIWIADLHDSRQLKALYNSASLFLYPSFYEGFGIPVAEALLSGVPVLTSDRSSLPEAGGASSFQADPADAGNIAHGIERILTDSELRNKMIKEGLNYATGKFSPEETSEEVFRFYVDMLSAD